MSPDGEKKLVTWTMVVLGAGNLFPWLCFITAVDYFQLIYGDAIMYTFALVNMIPCALTTIYLTFGSFSASCSTKINTGLSLLILILIAVVVVDHLLTLKVLSITSAHTTTMILVALCAMSTAMLQNGIYSLASMLGSDYTIALNSGQRSAGIAVIIIRVITKVTATGTGLGPMELSTLYYFCVAILVLATALCAWQKSKSTRLVSKVLGAGGTTKGEEEPLLPPSGSLNAEAKAQPSGSQRSQFSLAIDIFWQAKASCICVFLSFTVTLSCFPGMATSLKTYTDDPAHWFPVIMVGLYNTGDFIGVQIPRFVQVNNICTLLMLTVCHIAFLPLFILGVDSVLLPGVFKMNWYPMVITLLLGISNGFISCQCFVIAPRQVCAYMVSSCEKLLGAAGTSTEILDSDTKLKKYVAQGDHGKSKERLQTILNEEIGADRAADILIKLDVISPDAFAGVAGAVILFFLMCGLLAGSAVGMAVGPMLQGPAATIAPTLVPTPVPTNFPTSIPSAFPSFRSFGR
jgi:equilibrative nucleoside transporter 1/2/3